MKELRNALATVVEVIRLAWAEMVEVDDRTLRKQLATIKAIRSNQASAPIGRKGQ